MSRVINIEPVWAGHPVGFTLLTQAPWQFVVYYDADRHMSMAWRKLAEAKFQMVRLSSDLGWDSHNFVTMALDRDGYIHVSGNMHAEPLVYFRSDKPYDPTSIKPVHRMTGDDEGACDLPAISTGTPRGDSSICIATAVAATDGGSSTSTTRRPARGRACSIRRCSTARGRAMNAYPGSIVRGPDGLFHIVWMWRNTPDCRSNHDISYVRSRDMKHWETAGGRPGGAADHAARPRSRCRSDAAQSGHDQHEFPRRFRRGEEADRDLSQVRPQGREPDLRGAMGGRPVGHPPVERLAVALGVRRRGGPSPARWVRVPARVLDDGRLVLGFRNAKEGGGTWELDPATLKVKGKVHLPATYPGSIRTLESDFAGMKVRMAGDVGKSPSESVALSSEVGDAAAQSRPPAPGTAARACHAAALRDHEEVAGLRFPRAEVDNRGFSH